MRRSILLALTLVPTGAAAQTSGVEVARAYREAHGPAIIRDFADLLAIPNTASAVNSALPTPTAPIASGPSGPTMAMSTICIAIQPTSATTTGVASDSIGRSSRDSAEKI